jgi:hypothetical protein
MDKLFSTHPATENRIAQLEQLAARGVGRPTTAPRPRFAEEPRGGSGGWRIPPTGGNTGAGPWG